MTNRSRSDQRKESIMKVIVVYVGQGSLENDDHGLRNGVWGFKTNKRPSEKIEAGDYILFGRGFTGGSAGLSPDAQGKNKGKGRARGGGANGGGKEKATHRAHKKKNSHDAYIL